jgi:hypothetical protein
MAYGGYRRRRGVASFLIALLVAGFGIWSELTTQAEIDKQNDAIIYSKETPSTTLARDALSQLLIKGRAPKTDYRRAQFGDGWRKNGDCTTRELILARDMSNATIEKCKVLNGTLRDPYTNKTILFVRGPDTSDDVQIDHMVALSNAWQTGAQQLTFDVRENLANDPLNLLAVDGQTNQDKSDGDAATWLPPYKGYRCAYVARQIAIKQKYKLWITSGEHDAMVRVLTECPSQRLPTII